MSKTIDSSVLYLHNALRKLRYGIADMVRFESTGVPCWRCTGHIEAYYAESRLYALRCDHGCAGVFLIEAKNPRAAAEEIAGAHVGDIPGGGVPGSDQEGSP